MAGDQHSGETFVAIDIGKAFHAVLVELPDGANQRFRMANSAEDYARLVTFLRTLPGTVRVALEPTGNFHRTPAFHVITRGSRWFRSRPSRALDTGRRCSIRATRNDPKEPRSSCNFSSTVWSSTITNRCSQGITTCRSWRRPIGRWRWRCAESRPQESMPMSEAGPRPQVSPESVRAPVVASPRCPVCGEKELHGRQTASSASCRRERTRLRETAAREAQDREIRALLETALRKLQEGVP